MNVTSSSLLACTTPAGLSVGSHAILVDCNGINSLNGGGDAFTVEIIPAVTSVSPSVNVSTAPNVTLAITGLGINYSSGCRLSLGDAFCYASYSPLSAPDKIICITPGLVGMPVGSFPVLARCGNSTSINPVYVTFGAYTEGK